MTSGDTSPLGTPAGESATSGATWAAAAPVEAGWKLTAESLTDAERATLDRVVVKNTFASRFEQVPNGRTLLMLTEVQQ